MYMGENVSSGICRQRNFAHAHDNLDLLDAANIYLIVPFTNAKFFPSGFLNTFPSARNGSYT